MNPLSLLLAVLLFSSSLHAGELVALPHRVVEDQRTFVRPATDTRYSVWADDNETATKLAKDFGLKEEGMSLLKEGEILVVFLNDSISEDLVQITFNKGPKQTFADYADSGIKFRLAYPGEGKKYSHLTAVIFKPVEAPNHLGIRGMIRGGLSEKK